MTQARADIPAARVLLVGMMGAGKTSVGTALARMTGWPFLDNDLLVKKATGIAARELLNHHGEGKLRDAESAALTEGLRVAPPVIVDVAGGIVTRADDRRRLREAGFVVWLRARIDTLVQRVGRGGDRPWLGDDPEGALRRLYEGREPLYLEVADHVVDVDDVTPEQVAAAIVDALRGPASRS
ncbi:MAG: hypothetical protein GEV03_11550 [Streptosporangiales bacterium]|nr:hypothetical protein [Streptosporangiales bacterium]